MIRDTDRKITRENPQGGKGLMEVYPILEAHEMENQVTLLAKAALKAGASIGVHRHHGEMEAYYILDGTGIFTDDDGSRREVCAGCICAIWPGQSHGLENARKDKDLVFLAMVVPESGLDERP